MLSKAHVIAALKFWCAVMPRQLEVSITIQHDTRNVWGLSRSNVVPKQLQFISTFCLGRCMGRLLTHNVTPDYFSTPSLLASYSSRYVEAVMNCLLSRHNLEGMSRC